MRSRHSVRIKVGAGPSVTGKSVVDLNMEKDFYPGHLNYTAKHIPFYLGNEMYPTFELQNFCFKPDCIMFWVTSSGDFCRCVFVFMGVAQRWAKFNLL